MLHAHRRIAVPPETRFVLTEYARRRDHGDLGRPENRRALARRIVESKATHFRDLGIDADETVERVTAAPGTLGSVFGTIFQLYAERFGKPRWGDKRPAYLNNVHVMRRLFPDARFVSIVRDGRDCVASLKEMAWNDKDIYQTVASWARAVDNSRRAARALGPGQWFELRYEDLVADPHTQLEALCAYLGEDYDPAMAEPDRVAAQAVPGRKTWHARAHQPVDGRRVRSWERRLSPAEIALCEAALGSRLEACGYELTGAPRPPRSELMRYERAATPYRLLPARRSLGRAVGRLRREPDPAYAMDRENLPLP